MLALSWGKVKIFLKKSKYLIGISEKEFIIKEENITLEQFIEEVLKKEFPILNKILSNCLFAINQEYYYKKSINLKEGDEIALIPPISGG
jgi:molybdopterin converting factor small subunit